MSKEYSYIENRKYTSQDATLFEPTGPVVGFHQDGSPYQKWEIVVVGGNEITVWNAGTKTYACPSHEYQGAPVVGCHDKCIWHLLSVPAGWYQIATKDGKYVWRLTGDYDGAPIVLQETPYTGEDAQWGFNPA